MIVKYADTIKGNTLVQLIGTGFTLEGKEMKILDLGCGKNKYPNAIGVDIIKGEGVDVVHDLTKFPYPFKDLEFDLVIASNILEHIETDKSFFSLIKEVHRILKPNGIFEITVPHHKGFVSAMNPEHRRFFNIYTFDYFEKNGKQKHYLNNKSGVWFKITKKKYIMFLRGKKRILNIFNLIYNVNFLFTEAFLSNIFPPNSIRFELKKEGD